MSSSRGEESFVHNIDSFANVSRTGPTLVTLSVVNDHRLAIKRKLVLVIEYVGNPESSTVYKL